MHQVLLGELGDVESVYFSKIGSRANYSAGKKMLPFFQASANSPPLVAEMQCVKFHPIAAERESGAGLCRECLV
ncbi:hypothetical protein [Microbulbifer sp. THAF38]|uniref:hypothetical protein n=1 Tax=unclassified Microbulbifer TaxID=2619833 RepID=UPI001268FB9A|nr:hypothetical protein [Microbulbifer sp. THAF38]